MAAKHPFSERDLQIARELPENRRPARQYLDHLGPGSRRTMAEAVQKLARLLSGGDLDADTLPWHALRNEHTAPLRKVLAEGLAPSTANKHLAALRGVLRQACRAGLLDEATYRSAIDWPAVRGPARRTLRRLTASEQTALLSVCDRDPSPAGARDAALMALLVGAGLRRSEVVGLDLEDYERTSGTLRVRGGRGGRTRRFTANPMAREAMERWLTHRGDRPGPLFNPINKGGRLELRRLSEQAIYVACRKRSLEAGLEPASPEDLRRSAGPGRSSAPRSTPPTGPS